MRTRTLALCLIAVTAIVAACKPVPDAPADSAEPLVVLSVTYSGPRSESGPGGKGKHSVVCVVASDLARHYSERGEHIEIAIKAEESSGYMQGDPCPQGPVISRF